MQRLARWWLIALVVSPWACARQIDVIVGWSKPPYVIAETHSGFELELTRTILTSLGHELMPIYVPFGRTARLLESGAADIGLTLNIHHDISPEYLTNIYVIYQNAVITLASRNLKINTLADLEGYTIIGFQTASKLLGDDFAAVVNGKSSYLEIPEQSRQVSMLLLGSVDAVVMDRNIFSYMKSQMPKSQQRTTTVHPLFGISPYRAGIPDPTLRAQFNRELGEMMADGRYQALLDEFGLTNLFGELSAAKSITLPE